MLIGDPGQVKDGTAEMAVHAERVVLNEHTPTPDEAQVAASVYSEQARALVESVHRALCAERDCLGSRELICIQTGQEACNVTYWSTLLR